MENQLPSRKAWLQYWTLQLQRPELVNDECPVIRLIALITRAGHSVTAESEENATTMDTPISGFFNLYMCAIAYHMDESHGIVTVSYPEDVRELEGQLDVSRQIRLFSNLVSHHGVKGALERMPHVNADEAREDYVPLVMDDLALHIRTVKFIDGN